MGGQGGDAHHIKVPSKDGGVKPHDFWCIPLSREQHRQFHDMGRDAWEAEYSHQHGSQLENAFRTINLAIREGVLSFNPVKKQ